MKALKKSALSQLWEDVKTQLKTGIQRWAASKSGVDKGYIQYTDNWAGGDSVTKKDMKLVIQKIKTT